MAVLVGAELGNLVGGLFGAFVAALLAIPAAGALQVLVRELWQATGPNAPPTATEPGPQPGETEPTGENEPPGQEDLFPAVPEAREHGS
jgi:hypothetical protein